MRIEIGTSGYSYKEWKGTFYPEGLSASAMLRYYAERFSTVEINNTFYRMPTAKLLEGWTREVPEHFTFVLKAPQRITHQKKLHDAGDDIAHLFDISKVLGSRLGPFLFQIPPYLKKDVGRLREFLAALPEGRVALEVRSDTWLDDEVFELLRGRDIALCLSDTDEAEAKVIPTASWGYLRLRRTEYTDDDLAAWAARIREQPWSDVFLFFKHEDEGKGPEFAGRMKRILEDR